MKYLGSFSGKIISNSQPGLSYQATQTVKLSVKQCEKILHYSVIKEIDNTVGKKFDVEFAYVDTTNQISLCIENQSEDEQFNRDFAIELVQLCVDNLYTPRHFLFNGELTTKDKKIIDKGNTLWCTGQLIYKFNLPIVSNVITNLLT